MILRDLASQQGKVGVGGALTPPQETFGTRSLGWPCPVNMDM